MSFITLEAQGLPALSPEGGRRGTPEGDRSAHQRRAAAGHVPRGGRSVSSRGPSDVAIETVAPPSLRADAAFWRLYAESFDGAEREPPDVIVRSLDLGSGIALRAVAHPQTVGLATAHVLDGPGVTFLVYLAVDPGWRARRLGRALFDAADAAGRERLEARQRMSTGIVWEIDDPAADVSAAELNVRLRRLAFFEKLGGRILEGPYVQPPVDGHTPVPMRLMFRPASGSELPGPAATAALVRAIYFEKYHAINRIPVATLEELIARVAS